MGGRSLPPCLCNPSQVGAPPADGSLPPSFEGGEQRCFRRMFVCSEDLSQVGIEGQLAWPDRVVEFGTSYLKTCLLHSSSRD